MVPPVIVQVGNQASLHATEAAYRDGYTAAGCVVLGVTQDECLQRGQTWLYDRVREADAAMLVYSRTHSGTALTPDWTALWRRLEAEGTQTAGTHLDVFWGIPEREGWIAQGDPMFTVGTVFTADGGSDDKWTAAGVNHRWLPPGCDTRFIPQHFEPVEELVGKIVFVGSAYGYHPLWQHRADMIDFCSRTWPDRFVIYGNGSPNGPARGEKLAKVYASDCIVVGDFCFAGERANYWSDRIPESLGRSATLLVTDTPGLSDFYSVGRDLFVWPAGDFDYLADLVSFVESKGQDRPGPPEANTHIRHMKSHARFSVMRRDTYRHRASRVLEAVGIEVARDDG